MDKVAIAGGVASNGTLRAAMEEACQKHGYKFYRPSPIFCTDNAAISEWQLITNLKREPVMAGI